MQFTPSFLDEIRARLRPSSVVGKKVQLKARGNVHKGLCPFHNEKTPSFTVDDTRGTYHCFGCGEHGDIIKFVMETERLDFVEAVKQLAGEAGVALPAPDPYFAAYEKKTKSLYEIMEIAAKFFEDELRGANGRIAMDYIKSRGLKAESLAKFRIGFAPNSRFALKKFLEEKGISLQEMLDGGLIAKSDKGEVYDKFRNRVMFPICDIKNRVVAFGGRVLDDGMPKYLNSPETVLFKKSDILYNENHARKLAIKTGKLVVAEGYMDVIALDAAGIKTAVAPMGTAITESQVKHLWNMAKEPVMCLDGDTAGRRAMERVAHLCLPLLEPGYTLKFALMPDGTDPDEFIKAHGVANIRKLLQAARPLSEVLWDAESGKKKTGTPEGKAELESRLNKLTDTIKNATISKYYKDFFRNKLWAFNKAQYSKINNSPVNLTPINQTAKFDINSREGCETMLLLLVTQLPSLLKNADVHKEFDNENIEFSSVKLDKLRTNILQLCGYNDEINADDLRDGLEKLGFKDDIDYLLSIKKNFLIEDDISQIRALSIWNYYVSLYHLINLRSECSQIERQMTPESEKIVAEFRKQIVKIENKVLQMERAFGD
jgi:DNA primase